MTEAAKDAFLYFWTRLRHHLKTKKKCVAVGFRPVDSYICEREEESEIYTDEPFFE